MPSWEVSSVEIIDDIDIMRLRSGDRGAFESLVKTYYHHVYRLCLRMLGNPSDAEDITQDTFLRVHRSINKFKGDSALSTWVYRIAYNACLDETRRRKRRRVTYFSTHEEAHRALDVSDTGAGPEELVCAADDAQALRSCLAKMPIKYRAVLVLREIEDLSYEEIASVLNCPIGTVRSRLARGRRMLVENLRGRVQIDMPNDTRASTSS